MDSQGRRGGTKRPEEQDSPRTKQQRGRITLLHSILAALIVLAASPMARHWLPVIVANVCILGGIVAAPVMSVVAWIGLVLPTHALLHQIAPVLVAASLVWFGMAIVGAHALQLAPGNQKQRGGVDPK